MTRLKEGMLYIATFLGIVSTTFGIVNSCQSCSQANELAALRAIQNRPIINVEKVTFLLGDTEASSLNLDSAGFRSMSMTNISLFAKLEMSNTGSSFGKLKAIASGDSLSGDDILRRDIIDRNKWPLFVDDRYKEFFTDRTVRPMGRDSIIVPITIRGTLFFERSTGDSNIHLEPGTFHFLIVYENELGDIFDTYYWTTYSLGRAIIKPYFLKVKNGKQEFAFSRKAFSQDLIRPIMVNQSSHIYLSSEKKEVRDFLQK